MEIENQFQSIYQNIGEYNNSSDCNEQQFQPFINLNNSELKPQTPESLQFANFQNTSYDNNRY